jgi:hypothetical protein
VLSLSLPKNGSTLGLYIRLRLDKLLPVDDVAPHFVRRFSPGKIYREGSHKMFLLAYYDPALEVCFAPAMFQ